MSMNATLFNQVWDDTKFENHDVKNNTHIKAEAQRLYLEFMNKKSKVKIYDIPTDNEKFIILEMHQDAHSVCKLMACH